MENTQRTPYDGGAGAPAKKMLGLVIAFGVCFLMSLMGWCLDQCLMIFIGVLLFVIPRLFGVKGFKPMLALGFAFLLVVPAVGALAFTAPYINDNTQSDIDGVFSDVEIVQVGDTYTVTVRYSGEETGDVSMFIPKVGTTSFKRILIPTGTDPYLMNDTGSGTFTYTGLSLSSGTLYGICFERGDDESEEGIIDANISDSDVTSHALKWNYYSLGLVSSIYFLILILTTWMRSRLEKTRARLEAEGRLYPQGYGRCKECGMLILPGETACRKCGAYIEVPEEIKAQMKQKVDYTVCSECGVEVPADARRCPHCGADFEEEEEIVEK